MCQVQMQKTTMKIIVNFKIWQHTKENVELKQAPELKTSVLMVIQRDEF